MSSSLPRSLHWAAIVTALCAAVGAQRPRAVAGEVRNADGRPVAGARVHLVSRRHPELPGRITMRMEQEAFAEVTAITDARGRFRVETRDAGPFGIWAELKPSISGMQFPVSAGDFRTLRLERSTETKVRLAEKAMELAPQALVLDHPVEAWVIPDDIHWLADLPYPAIRLQARTDKKGECSFAMPPGRTYRVSASLGKRQVVRWPGHSEGPIRLTSLPPISYRGRLLDDATGAPIAGALIHDLTAPAVRTVTDKDGVFALSVRPFSFLHVVPKRHQHGVLGPQHNVFRSRGSDLEKLRLEKGRRLSVRLLDRADKPLAGARLVFAGAGGDMRLPGASHLAVWTDRAGPDGRISVGWLGRTAPLAAFVEVNDRFVWFLLRGAGDDLDLGDVRVSGGSHVSGKVADGNRAPLVGANVYLQPVMPDRENYTLFAVPPGFLGRVTVTDRGGRFRFEGLEPGRYEIAVDAPGHGRMFVQAVAPTRKPLSLSLAAGEVLRGIVQDERRDPAAKVDVLVAIQPPNQAWKLSAWRFGLATYRTTTDVDGRFSISGLPRLTRCSVDVRRHRNDRAAAVSRYDIKPGDGEVRLVLPRRGKK